jgi:hypothetical protein
MFTEAKFVQVAEDELAMLQDVLRVNVLHGVVDSMNMWITVLKRRLENKRSRETITCGGAVV